jgi:hypothetical protein
VRSEKTGKKFTTENTEYTEEEMVLVSKLRVLRDLRGKKFFPLSYLA